MLYIQDQLYLNIGFTGKLWKQNVCIKPYKMKRLKDYWVKQWRFVLTWLEPIVLAVDDASLLQLVFILKLLTVVWRFLEHTKKCFNSPECIVHQTQCSPTLCGKIWHLPRPIIILRLTKKILKNQLQNPFLESKWRVFWISFSVLLIRR